MIRVIQVSTGNVGTHALRAIIQHPGLELAGLWVHGQEKIGQDAGVLAGLPRWALPPPTTWTRC